MTDKDEQQAAYFRNRLVKNEHHLRRWAKTGGIEAFRLYDNDIPEVPLALDRYGLGQETALHLALYERPYDKDEGLEADWLKLMAATAAEALAVRSERVFIKTRRRLRGLEQYEKLSGKTAEMVVKEAGLSFIVNLSDYIDTGLFLDHRTTRSMVREGAAGKRVLNLFSYTGSFSVYAAAGGATAVTSVDLSNTYLAWAERNLELNGFSAAAHPMVHADVSLFLADAAGAGARWDLIVADPPTFSNSKSAPADFDVNKDWPALIEACGRVLAPGGTMYFSTNSRKLKWDPARIPISSKDISAATIPKDFRDERIHRCWLLSE
jgi:23S rRNA G2069 N7-methylase RlmK/C1962 C5-methylase RlmI